MNLSITLNGESTGKVVGKIKMGEKKLISNHRLIKNLGEGVFIDLVRSIMKFEETLFFTECDKGWVKDKKTREMAQEIIRDGMSIFIDHNDGYHTEFRLGCFDTGVTLC